MSGNDAYGYGYDYSYQSVPNPGPGHQPYYGQYGQAGYTGNAYSSPQQAASQAPPQQQQPGMDFFNNPAAQIGVQFGAQALSAGQQYVNSNVKEEGYYLGCLYIW